MDRAYSQILWSACLLTSVFTSQLAAAGEPKQETFTPRQLLARMSMQYADSKSYRDSGILETTYIRADGTKTVEKKPFSTVFVRPERFRFEHQSGPEHYLIWSDGKNVRRLAQSWDGEPPVREPASLGEAVEASLSVARSMVFGAPVLLMPGKFQMRPLTALERAERIEDRKLGNDDCFRIAGDYFDSPTVIWIDKKTFLIRRIDSSMQNKTFRTEDTVTFEPIINQKIPAKMLQFDLPK